MGYIIKSRYVGTGKIRPEQVNPYTPTANTKFYYPLINDQLDVTNNTSLTGTLSKQSIGYKSTKTSIDITGSENKDIRFVSYRVFFNEITSGSYARILTTIHGYMHFIPSDSNSSHVRTVPYVIGTNSNPYSNAWYHSSQQSIDFTKWHHMAYGMDSNNNYIWVLDGTQVWSGRASGTQYYSSSQIASLCTDKVSVTFSDVIGEDRLWTLQEIQSYFNSVKSKYGY